MSDINVSIGLQTEDALKASKEYIKSLDDIIKKSEKLEKQNTDIGSSFKKGGNEVKGLSKKLITLSKDVNKVGTSVSGVSNNMDKLAKKIDTVTTSQKRQSAQLTQTNGLWQAAKRVALAYIGINTAKSIVNTVSAFDALNASLKIVAGSRASEEMAFITSEALRLGLSITDVGKEYVKLTAAAKGTIIAGMGVRDIFTSVSESARALNLSADDTKGAFRA